MIYLGWNRNKTKSFILAVINPNIPKPAQRDALFEAIRFTKPHQIERIA